MDLAAEEGPSGYDDIIGFDDFPRFEFHADDLPVMAFRVDVESVGGAVDHDIRNRALDEREVRIRVELSLHVLLVQRSVYLCSRSPDGGSFTAVENPKLDTGFVGDATAEAVKGVNLSDHSALADTSERGVAGAGADGVQFLGYEGGLCAGPGSSCAGFRASMASADNNNIEFPSCTVSHKSMFSGVCSGVSWGVCGEGFLTSIQRKRRPVPSMGASRALKSPKQTAGAIGECVLGRSCWAVGRRCR